LGGAAELIEDGVSGLIVDPADDHRVVDAVARLGDDATRGRIGAAAATVAARHGEPDNFRQVERVLRAARDRGHGPVGAAP
jgi:glycosyltransferase involved in cell wall biosynthesis